jgi:putative acyl-CoA dehydrogenase
VRAIKKEPEALERVREEIRLCGDKRVTNFAIHCDVQNDVQEQDARVFAERLALALQASLMLRFSPAGDAFCASRIEGNWGRAFGTLPQGLDLHPILEHA